MGNGPLPTLNPQVTQSAPRTRGDGPSAQAIRTTAERCSPHPRGWSRPWRNHRHRRDLLPAPAGMVPVEAIRVGVRWAAPRTRGDGPSRGGRIACQHTCSPHSRGWSLTEPQRLAALLLLPAPAGMVPTWDRSTPRRRSAPRTRGDGPAAVALAHNYGLCSPRPRGWSRSDDGAGHRNHLLPAPAGWSLGGVGGCVVQAFSPHLWGWPPAVVSEASSGSCSPRKGWFQL